MIFSKLKKIISILILIYILIHLKQTIDWYKKRSVLDVCNKKIKTLNALVINTHLGVEKELKFIMNALKIKFELFDFENQYRNIRCHDCINYGMSKKLLIK